MDRGGADAQLPALQAHLGLAAEQAAHARGRVLLPAQDELDLQGEVLAQGPLADAVHDVDHAAARALVVHELDAAQGLRQADVQRVAEQGGQQVPHEQLVVVELELGEHGRQREEHGRGAALPGLAERQQRQVRLRHGQARALGRGADGLHGRKGRNERAERPRVPGLRVERAAAVRQERRRPEVPAQVLGAGRKAQVAGLQILADLAAGGKAQELRRARVQRARALGHDAPALCDEVLQRGEDRRVPGHGGQDRDAVLRKAARGDLLGQEHVKGDLRREHGLGPAVGRGGHLPAEGLGQVVGVHVPEQGDRRAGAGAVHAALDNADLGIDGPDALEDALVADGVGDAGDGVPDVAAVCGHLAHPVEVFGRGQAHVPPIHAGAGVDDAKGRRRGRLRAAQADAQGGLEALGDLLPAEGEHVLRLGADHVAGGQALVEIVRGDAVIEDDGHVPRLADGLAQQADVVVEAAALPAGVPLGLVIGQGRAVEGEVLRLAGLAMAVGRVGRVEEHAVQVVPAQRLAQRGRGKLGIAVAGIDAGGVEQVPVPRPHGAHDLG